jgi:hypothetical protein
MLSLATEIERIHRATPLTCTRGRLLGCLLLMIPFTANALTYSLDIELDTGRTSDFIRVDIVENGDDALDFIIAIDSDLLGADADLNALYFNIDDSLVDPEGLRIEWSNAPVTAYQLVAARGVRGGAGSAFDFSIDFGDGASSRGNGVLQVASLTLTGLTLESLSESSYASGGSIEIGLAAHVQGTSLYPGVTSETLGGSLSAVPEPAAGSMTLFGLLVLGARRYMRTRWRWLSDSPARSATKKNLGVTPAAVVILNIATYLRRKLSAFAVRKGNARLGRP